MSSTAELVILHENPSLPSTFLFLFWKASPCFTPAFLTSSSQSFDSSLSSGSQVCCRTQLISNGSLLDLVCLWSETPIKGRFVRFATNTKVEGETFACADSSSSVVAAEAMVDGFGTLKARPPGNATSTILLRIISARPRPQPAAHHVM